MARLKQFKLWEVPDVVGSIVVVGVLTHTVLLHSMSDLRAIEMNVQYSLILKLRVYKFELAQATKNICFTKGEGIVDQNTVNR